MNIRNDTSKSENPMDNLSNPNFQFTSVFRLRSSSHLYRKLLQLAYRRIFTVPIITYQQ